MFHLDDDMLQFIQQHDMIEILVEPSAEDETKNDVTLVEVPDVAH